MFCQKCGNLMIADKKKGYLVCRKCGFRIKSKERVEVVEKLH